MEFTSFKMKYTDSQIMQELIKLLNRYKIIEKFFKIVTDNISNNKILKDELNKALNRREYI